MWVSKARLVASSRSAISVWRFGKRCDRHRHRDGDRIAERILQGDADGADAERVLLAIKAIAGAAHGFEVGEQRIEARERLRRALLVAAADQRLDGGSESCAR